MDTSSPDTSSQPARFLKVFGRPALLVTSLAILVLAVAVSCGGGDDDDSSEEPAGADRDSDREFVIETFTPTVPGQEDEAQATREEEAGAQRTAAANTATARANEPTPTAGTPAPTTAPSGPSIGGTPDPNAFRPPFAYLSDGTNRMDGIFGPYGLIDEASQSYVLIAAPFFDVGDDGLTVAPGSELEFSMEGDFAPPSGMTASVYTWEDNSSIPTDTEGNVGSHLWFVPATDPVSTAPMDVANPTVAMPDEPGRYVVQIRSDWPPDERLDPVQQPLFTVYAFTVYVE